MNEAADEAHRGASRIGGEKASSAIVPILLSFESQDSAANEGQVRQDFTEGKADFSGSLLEDVREPEGLGIAENVEDRSVKDGMAVVLGPLGVAEAAIKAANGPIGNSVDDTIGKSSRAEITEMLPHFDGKGLAAVRDFFPTDDFVGDGRDAWGQRFVGGGDIAGINGEKTGQEPGHVAQIGGNGGGFERAAEQVVASSKVGSVEGKLPVAAFLGDVNQK